MADVDEILKKYGRKISKQINSEDKTGNVSREYEQFKKDMVPQLSRYEKYAKSFGGILKINLAKKDREKLEKNINASHLDITPSEVAVFSFFSMAVVFFFGFMVFLLAFFYSSSETGLDGLISFLFGPAGLFLFLCSLVSVFIFYYAYSFPTRMANKWRLKAGAQMVPCILYIVIYMKHTLNLERAVAFASRHLKPPLSLDLKKIFWDVETGKFSTIKESLDNYLKTWEKDAMEFVEAFHLIESSLYEPSESRRFQILEKALQVILDGVYEKTLAFSRQVRSPLTNVYMLGIVLPTLGVALIPLASTLLQGMIKWYHVFILFNLVIPFFVFYLTTQIMLKRPEGYGESEILELNPLYPKYKSRKPYFIAFFLSFPLFVLGTLPFLFYFGAFDYVGLQRDYSLANFGLPGMESVMFFDFKDVSSGETLKTASDFGSADGIAGPFGIGALILSLFIPLSIAMFFSVAYNRKTKEIIKSREGTKQLENEFTNSLFQLGNRLGDGIPAENAFARVAESTRGQRTEDFFRRVNLNLHQAGMGLEAAIFDQNRGAIIYFPSDLIATSMKILLESSKKGLDIAARSLMSISDYIKNIHKVEERMKDLLAEVVSDMRSNMVFLAPLLSGVVIGLSAMIGFILNKLWGILGSIVEGESIAGFSPELITGIFNILKMIPPYYLQVAIGIYLVQIIFILTNVLVTVDSGDDKLKYTYDAGKNLSRGMLMYFITSLFSIFLLSIIAGIALSGV